MSLPQPDTATPPLTDGESCHHRISRDTGANGVSGDDGEAKAVAVGKGGHRFGKVIGQHFSCEVAGDVQLSCTQTRGLVEDGKGVADDRKTFVSEWASPNCL